MKNLITILALLISTYGISQTKSVNGTATIQDLKIHGLNVSVDVDSVEEIESTFSVKDIKEILNHVSDNEEVSFEIVCNGKPMSSGVKSHVSYKVKGNTDDIKGFLKSVKKIRKAAIKYYKAK